MSIAPLNSSQLGSSYVVNQASSSRAGGKVSARVSPLGTLIPTTPHKVRRPSVSLATNSRPQDAGIDGIRVKVRTPHEGNTPKLLELFERAVERMPRNEEKAVAYPSVNELVNRGLAKENPKKAWGEQERPKTAATPNKWTCCFSRS